MDYILTNTQRDLIREALQALRELAEAGGDSDCKQQISEIDDLVRRWEIANLYVYKLAVR